MTQELMQIFGKGRGQAHREELHIDLLAQEQDRCRVAYSGRLINTMDETKVCQCSIISSHNDSPCQ